MGMEVGGGFRIPSGPVAETALPMLGARLQSLVTELDPTCCN